MNELDMFGDLPVEIRQTQALRAERIRLRMKRTAEDIVEIGRELTEAKAELGHGNFLTWIENEFEMSERTARRFMNVAERFGSKTASLSDLSKETIYELAAPSTPEPVIQEVIARTEAGEILTVAEVKSLKMQLKAKEDVAKAEMERAAKLKKENYQLLDTVSELKTKLAEQPKEILDKQDYLYYFLLTNIQKICYIDNILILHRLSSYAHSGASYHELAVSLPVVRPWTITQDSSEKQKKVALLL